MSAGNLKAVLDAMGVTVLYDGPDATSAMLSDSVSNYDAVCFVSYYTYQRKYFVTATDVTRDPIPTNGTEFLVYGGQDGGRSAFKLSGNALSITSGSDWRISKVIGIKY